MNVSRKLVMALLLALLPLVAALPAGAASPVATHDVVREKVNWTIPAGQCPNLAPGLSITGTGNRVQTTDTILKADGSGWAAINDVVQGTALDNKGGTYSFYYANFSTYDAPASSATVQGRMYDLFLLQSQPPLPGNRYVLRNGFAWRWTFTPPAGPFDIFPPANFQRLVEFGNSASAVDFSSVCDPI